MKWRLLAVAASVVAIAALSAVAFAQLGDTQTASGTINVSTTSADLYICEPDSTLGPDCGSDDSGADETVFETLEDMLPADRAQWDIRLKNVGTEDWIVTAGGQFDPVTVVETLDPGDDCPDGVLGEPFPTSVTVLGKDGDELNDNILVDSPQHVPGAAIFVRESLFPSQSNRVQIKVAPGDYEDLRLRLELDTAGTENCGGNEWNVSWEFVVAPVSP
jgi:hypothetical protein